MIGVNAAKETIRQFLLIEKPGPGYSHFPKDRPENYFNQLTAEKLVLERKAGHTVKKWVLQRGHANEAGDARVYAYAALRGLHVVRRFDFEKRAKLLESISGDSDKKMPPQRQVSDKTTNSRVHKSAWMD